MLERSGRSLLPRHALDDSNYHYENVGGKKVAPGDLFTPYICTSHDLASFTQKIGVWRAERAPNPYFLRCEFENFAKSCTSERLSGAKFPKMRIAEWMMQDLHKV